jgi:hypothetical protein
MVTVPPCFGAELPPVPPGDEGAGVVASFFFADVHPASAIAATATTAVTDRMPRERFMLALLR